MFFFYFRDLTTVRCQKCLDYGHYTYECQNKRKVLLRDSRTKILNKNLDNPLKRKIEVAESCPKSAKKIVRKESKSKTKKKKSSGSDSSSSSSESSSSSGSSSSSSSSEDSESDSSSSNSSSGSDSD